MKFFKRLSLVPRGLRYKLMVAFCLMSIIPLLVSVYLTRDYIYKIFVVLLSPDYTPIAGDIINASWTLFFCVVITILGLLLARQMIEPVIEMSLDARLIARGDFDRRINVSTEDEIGDLGHSINKLTLLIKENMEELASYGEKTKLINTAIHRRVLALSSLLQIGENISTAVQMEDVMNLITEKIVQVMDVGFAALFLPKPDDTESLELNIANNLSNEKIREMVIRTGRGLLGKSLADGTVIYADVKTSFLKEVEGFRQDYDIKNFAAFPVISHNRPVGMLLIGNDADNFAFNTDDLELVKVFAKQVAIAYDSDVLAKKVKELAIKDDLTDLYNEKYITARLGEEIKRSILYQRPCSYVVFNIDGFNKFREENGELATEKALKKIANVMEEYVTQIGRAARLSGDEFALLLPEKTKKETYRIAEEVRKRVEDLDLQLEKKANLTISGGVSENPIDGSSAEELMRKAADSVSEAKTQGKNRIA